MSWYIDSNYNEGYPYNTEMPSNFINSYTHNVDGVYYNIYSWRISPGYNEGYPFTWANLGVLLGWWHDGRPLGSYEGDSDSGMTIGGSQSNYPNGFHDSNRGGIRDQMDNKSMDYGGNKVTTVGSSVFGGLSGRIFVVNPGELNTIVNFLNTGLSTLEQTKVQLLYGSSVYDAFLVAKAYPMELPMIVQGAAKVFGDINLPGTYCAANGVVMCLDFEYVDLNIKQAWEIEHVDYSIYLPYAGTFPLDIRGPHRIAAKCYVDLYTGVGEYYVFVDNQLQGVHKCQIGADIPLNFNQGIMSANMASFVTSTVSKGLPLVGAAAGGAVGGAVGGIAAGTLGSLTNHQQVSDPQVGALTSVYCYPYARVIAKIPKMFNDGYGFAETQGESRKTAYVRLDSCSGYIKTLNYKCDVIIATTEEKQEIERLLDAGVFL